MKKTIALVLALFAGFVQAQALPAPVFPSTVSGATYTYSGATASSANAASIAFGNPANGAVYAQASQSVGLPAGRSATVAIRSAPAMADIAVAVGRFASKVATPLVVGVALWDLCNELGFGCSGGGSQPLVVTKMDPNVCGVAPCYTWSMAVPGYPTFTASTPSGVCAAGSAALKAYYSPRLTGSISAVGSGTQYACNGLLDGKATNVMSMSRGASIPAQSNAQPSTLQTLQDAIAAQSGWPSGSALPRTIADAVASGQTLPLPTPNSITGPASVTGPSTTTTTPAQNGQPAQTTTTSTVSNITYGPNTVTVTNNTTTTVNNGTTTTTTTKTEEPELAPSDTVNPSQPTLYTRKYPDGISGVWNAKKGDILSSPLANLPASLQPTIAAPSGYPSWPIPFVIGKWNWGTYDVSPPPLVWDFLKVCILISCGFLCRAIIFGG